MSVSAYKRFTALKPWFRVKIKLFQRISDPSRRHRPTVLFLANVNCYRLSVCLSSVCL